MNRSYGNLPIAWANSPSIVFNKRTSGWMPPAYSTLQGRNQIVQVDENMNFVKELSNEFPTAQVAVWDTPQGQMPPGAIPGSPYAPGAAPLSGAWGAFMDTAKSVTSVPMSFLEKWKDWVMGLGAFGSVLYWASIAVGVLFVLGKTKFGRKLVSGLGLSKLPLVGALVKKKNPVRPFGRWKKKSYARRHGKKKMSASYMKRHNRKGRRSRRAKR